MISPIVQLEDARIEEPPLVAPPSSTAAQLFARAPEPLTHDSGMVSGPTSISQRFGVELKGTVAGEIAIVLDLATGAERILHMGDAVGSGHVESISRSETVITDGTIRETLTLSTGPTPSPANPTGGGKRVIERKQLSDILSRVDRISQEISLTPVRSADGDAAGYRITAMKPRGFFSTLGVAQNDMITAINGQTIRTVEDLHRILGEASHSTQLTLNIRRNQHDLQLRFDVR